LVDVRALSIRELSQSLAGAGLSETLLTEKLSRPLFGESKSQSRVKQALEQLKLYLRGPESLTVEVSQSRVKQALVKHN